MSVIITLIDKGKVYIAVDGQTTIGNRKKLLENKNNLKIWKTKGLENSIMAHTGSYRDLGILKFTDFFKEAIEKNIDIDYEYLQSKTIYNIFEECKKKDFVEEVDGLTLLSSGYILAYKDKAYELAKDLSVFEVENFLAKGSGSEYALGSLHTTKGEEPIKRLLKALNAAIKFDLYVNYPVYITDTENCEIKMYTEEDVERIINSK